MKTIFSAAVFFLLLGTPAFAREVNVVLNDDRVIQGELLGISSETVFVKTGKRAESIPADAVVQMFDAATGEPMALTHAAERPGRPTEPTPTAEAQPAMLAPDAEPLAKPLFFVSATLDSGLVAYAPSKPLEGTYIPGHAYVVGTNPYDLAWGLGLGVEYRFLDAVAGMVDFGFSRWEKLLARKDGYAVGDWIWEQSDYTDARVGPFPMDVKYYMDTAYVRVGAKYYPLQGVFQPFVGGALGVYSWQAVIGNREEEKKYADCSDVAFSTSVQVGVDLVLDEFVLRFFADLGTAAGNPRFENLFVNGWTFENLGGEHVQGPYRFGAALGMTF